MDYLAKLGAVLVAALTIAGILSHLVSRALERSIDRRVMKWSNTPDGEEHWFAKNDKWFRDRGHDKKGTHERERRPNFPK
jgi:hypothetical protein